MGEGLRRPCLLQSSQDGGKPAVPRLPQPVHLAPVRPLDRLRQGALLLRLELVPGRELGPRRLEAVQQALQEQRHPALSRREVIGAVGPPPRPPAGGPQRHRAVPPPAPPPTPHPQGDAPPPPRR